MSRSGRIGYKSLLTFITSSIMQHREINRDVLDYKEGTWPRCMPPAANPGEYLPVFLEEQGQLPLSRPPAANLGYAL